MGLEGVIRINSDCYSTYDRTVLISDFRFEVLQLRVLVLLLRRLGFRRGLGFDFHRGLALGLGFRGGLCF